MYGYDCSFENVYGGDFAIEDVYGSDYAFENVYCEDYHIEDVYGVSMLPVSVSLVVSAENKLLRLLSDPFS